MTTIPFPAEWALRSSMLILAGALLLRALRVKDPSVRLAAWTAMLFGSLAIPVLTAALPAMPLVVWKAPAQPVNATVTVFEAAERPLWRQGGSDSKPFDWGRAAFLLYVGVAGALLLRLCAGLAMSRRLLRGSRATGQAAGGIEIRESDRVAAPITLGIARSTIVLPADWREWDATRLNAVLAHERSHILRRDPAVQLLSAIHRALVWHSPLSWFLHMRIVRVAEEASDDAAVAVTSDRASYAELLLDFMQRGVRGANWQGVAMARYGRPEERIHRILDGTALSRGVTRWGVAAILAVGSPLAYLAAAAHPQTPPAPAAAPQAAQAPQAAAAPQLAKAPQVAAAPQAASAPQLAAQQQSGTIRRYIIFMDGSTSGSWDTNDMVDEQGLRRKFGQHFAWFRQNGNEYVVTDSGVLGELQKAMEPQKEVNRMQGEVNAHQSRVNAMQSGVNSQQNDVNALQQEANRRQNLLNRIQAAAGKQDQAALVQELEAALKELRAAKNDTSQDAVNRRQTQVNDAQSRVNAEQGVVNAEQHKVNDEQRRVSAEFNRQIQEILDSAVRRHLVQQQM